MRSRCRSLVHVVRLDELGAELGADAARQANVLGVTRKLLANCGNPITGIPYGGLDRPAGSCCVPLSLVLSRMKT